MTEDLLYQCFASYHDAVEQGAELEWLDYWGKWFSNEPDLALRLVQTIIGEDEVFEEALDLLCRVLDEARMNRENGTRGAERFFAHLEAGLGALDEEDALPPQARLALCSAFTRAGLTPPDCITLPDESDPALVEFGPEAPDISELIADLVPDGTPADQTYDVLREGLSAMGRGASGAFVVHMIAQSEPKLVHLGRYFLIDPVQSFRRAAAAGFAQLASARGINATLLSDLIALRKWMPADAAQSALDKVIRDVLRQEVSGGAVAKPWTVHRILSSLPDGAGAQSLLATCSQGSRKCLVALMIKQGFGVKDAYIVPCSGASEQKRLLAEISVTMPFSDISQAYLHPALSAALADGLRHGLPPAVGLIDVAPVLGLAGATPQSAPLLDQIDPKGEIAALPAAKLGRLIGQSRHWFDSFDMADSWFETSAELSDALARCNTHAAEKKALWSYLETRRDWWAQHFARCAQILKHSIDADPQAWLSFAAVSHGLIQGRALKKIPIFEDIAEDSLEAAINGALAEPGAWDTDLEADPDLQVLPETKGELDQLLKGSGLTPHGINGFLTALLIAPEFVSPTDWLPALMGGIEFPGEGSVQRLVDIVMLRYGEINDAVLAREIGHEIRELSAQELTDWAAGFSRVTSTLPHAWPKRALKPNDRKLLTLIKDGATQDLSSELKPILPAWLALWTDLR